jgi:hypothetical protein
MNHSIYSADRTTHLKIVIAALMAGIAIANLALLSRGGSDAPSTEAAGVLRAGRPVAITSSDASITR